LYESALRLQPGLAVAHAQLGAILLRANRIELAVAHWRAAAELVPDDWLVHANYAQALLAAGRRDEAKQRFQRALQLNPEQPQAKAALEGLLRAP
jgi:Flp pilus assembly protein TadD